MSNALKQQTFSKQPLTETDSASIRLLYAMGLGQHWETLQDKQPLDAEAVQQLYEQAPLAGLLKIASISRRESLLRKPAPLLLAPVSTWLAMESYAEEVAEFFSKVPFSKPTLQLGPIERIAVHPRFSELLDEIRRQCPEVSFLCRISDTALVGADIWSRKKLLASVEQLRAVGSKLTIAFSSAIAAQQFNSIAGNFDAELMLISDLRKPVLATLECIYAELARVSELCSTEGALDIWAFRWDGEDSTAEQILQYVRLVTLASGLCPLVASIGVLGCEQAELFPLLRAGSANYFGFGAAHLEAVEEAELPEVRHLRALVEQLRQRGES